MWVGPNIAFKNWYYLYVSAISLRVQSESCFGKQFFLVPPQSTQACLTSGFFTALSNSRMHCKKWPKEISTARLRAVVPYVTCPHSRAIVVFKELNTMPRIPASREIVIVQGRWKRSKAICGGRGNANSKLFPEWRGCDDDGCVGGATSALFLNLNSAPIHALSLECEQVARFSLQIARSPRHRMRSIWKWRWRELEAASHRRRRGGSGRRPKRG